MIIKSRRKETELGQKGTNGNIFRTNVRFFGEKVLILNRLYIILIDRNDTAGY